MYPILFKIGPLTLYTYGLALAVAFVVATLVVYNTAKTEGLDTTKLADLGFFGILSGIIGSRILYILINPSEYIANPLKIFMLWEGGLIFYGWHKLPYNHSVWHLFVLGGSIFHYFSILYAG